MVKTHSEYSMANIYYIYNNPDEDWDDNDWFPDSSIW